ncbi:MAG: hypothetical protein R3331_09235 [Sulfurospirillaceae bacterium]|nr:hypothetical protein [Sulfurospirillaceae bacterium]
MKKIILLLLTVYSFSSATTVVINGATFTTTSATSLSQGDVIQLSDGRYKTVGVVTPQYPSSRGDYCAYVPYINQVLFNDNTGNFSVTTYIELGAQPCSWSYSHYSYAPGTSTTGCPSGQTVINGVCSAPPTPTCDAVNTYPDGNGGCVDCSSFTSLTSVANCMCQHSILDGSGGYTQTPSVTTLQTINNIKYEVATVSCDNSALQVTAYSEVNASKPPINECFIQNVYYKYQPSGYVYVGVVSNDAECQQYKDGVNYLNAQTHPVFDNCPTDKTLFCYLKPALDNNNTGITPVSDMNFSNGTVLADTNLSAVDSSTISHNNYDFNSTSQTNAVATAMADDVKNFVLTAKQQLDASNGFHQWYKDAHGNWVAYKTQADSNQLSATQATTSAVNSVKSSVDSLHTDVNNLINHTPVDSSGADLSNVANIINSLHDFNVSTSQDDGNLSKPMSTDDQKSFVASAYNDFGTRATDALTSAFNSINYSFISDYSIPSYDFVDYDLPTISLLGMTFSGHLMNASFLNSLDFSLARFALLIACLLWCLSYIMHKAF